MYVMTISVRDATEFEVSSVCEIIADALVHARGTKRGICHEQHPRLVRCGIVTDLERADMEEWAQWLRGLLRPFDVTDEPRGVRNDVFTYQYLKSLMDTDIMIVSIL